MENKWFVLCLIYKIIDVIHFAIDLPKAPPKLFVFGWKYCNKEAIWWKLKAHYMGCLTFWSWVKQLTITIKKPQSPTANWGLVKKKGNF